MLISILQLTTAVVWFVTAVITTPGTCRLFFGRARLGDASKSAFFFTAVVFVGGSSRWLLRPDDLTSWAIVYALSILLAIYVWVIVWNIRRDRSGSR